MAMSPDEVTAYIQNALPDAIIELEALVNDGDHYKVIVTSQAFEGLSRVKQHQLVYKAFGGKMGHELHALSLVTKVPAESKE